MRKGYYFMKILLIGKDPYLAIKIKKRIQGEGDHLHWLQKGTTSIHALRSESFDSIVLDNNLPSQGDPQLLRAIREKGYRIPILFLSCCDAVASRVQALDAGADDYLIKPFDLNELNVRLHALLRGSQRHKNVDISYRGIHINPLLQQITYWGKPVQLSRREYLLLKELLAHAGKVLSRDCLKERLYGWQDHIASNALEVHVHNLRKKFHNPLIQTVRGVGYRINAA